MIELNAEACGSFRTLTAALHQGMIGAQTAGATKRFKLS
jgi:hypothetical protein